MNYEDKKVEFEFFYGFGHASDKMQFTVVMGNEIIKIKSSSNYYAL